MGVREPEVTKHVPMLQKSLCLRTEKGCLRVHIRIVDISERGSADATPTIVSRKPKNPLSFQMYMRYWTTAFECPVPPVC